MLPAMGRWVHGTLTDVSRSLNSPFDRELVDRRLATCPTRRLPERNVSVCAIGGSGCQPAPPHDGTWLTLSQVARRSKAVWHQDLHRTYFHLAQVRTPSQQRRHHPIG